MILHIFQYPIDKNTRLDTQNVSKTQKNIDVPHIVCYNLFDKGAYIMDTNANIKDLKKVVKTLRIVWCFTLVFAVYFLRSASTLS